MGSLTDPEKPCYVEKYIFFIPVEVDPLHKYPFFNYNFPCQICPNEKIQDRTFCHDYFLKNAKIIWKLFDPAVN